MFNSIRRRLLAWLVIPLLFMSVAHLATSYLDNRKNSQQIFDKLLVTLAISISEHALSSGGDLLTDDVLEMIRNTTNDNLYYKVIGPDAAFVSGYENIPSPPGGIDVIKGNVQFYDTEYLGRPVRVIAMSTLVNNVDYEGWMTTFVAQTLRDREEYVHSFFLNDLYRVSIMIIIASLLLSVGVTLGLRPLKRVQDSVHNRNPQDLSPIETTRLPTELTGLVAELNSLLNRLGAHLSLTKRFVENAAHQLRTPVTSLLPQTELALRSAESEREYQAISKIKRSADNIARLTNQLLNLTYAESVALSEQAFPRIDLADIIAQTAANFRAQHPDIILHTQLQSAPINGAAMFIEEVLKNLLDNSLKYSSQKNSSPSIEIQLTSYQHNNQSVMTVSDNGPGIPAELRTKVTERFFRIESQQNGSGLGLAIVKEMVETHAGELTLSDNIERGEVENSSDEHELTRTQSGLKVTCKFPVASEG